MTAITDILKESAIQDFIEAYENNKYHPDKEVVIKRGKIKTKESMSTKKFCRRQVTTRQNIDNYLSNKNPINGGHTARSKYNKNITARDIYEAIMLSDNFEPSVNFSVKKRGITARKALAAMRSRTPHSQYYSAPPSQPLTGNERTGPIKVIINSSSGTVGTKNNDLIGTTNAIRNLANYNQGFRNNGSSTNPRKDILSKTFTTWNKLGVQIGERLPKHESIQKLLTPLEQKNIHVFLGELQKSRDYEQASTQALLFKRVKNMLELLSYAELRERVTALIELAISSCDDLVTHTLNEIDMLKIIEDAKNKAISLNSDTPLRNVARQCICLDVIEKIARKNTEKNPGTDEIAISLALQTRLRVRLDLPGKSTNMNYRDPANLYENDYKEAERKIREACTKKAISERMKTLSGWQYFKRHKEIPTFESLEVEYVKKIENCAIFLDKDKSVNMLSFSNEHVSYEGLSQVYRETGKNPFRAEGQIDWSQVKRLQIAKENNI